MPSQKINEWLDEVCAHILRPSYKKNVRKELEGHINDRIRQLENDGLSYEKAVEQAICLMGDAKKLGQAFAKRDHCLLSIRKILLNFAIWIMIVILLFYLINHIK